MSRSVILSVAVLCGPLLGCSNDPKSSFEKIVKELRQRVEKPIETVIEEDADDTVVPRVPGQWYRLKWEYEVLGYDIRKTDSVVTPLRGVIVVREKRLYVDDPKKPGYGVRYPDEARARAAQPKWASFEPKDMTLIYNYQNENWVPTSNEWPAVGGPDFDRLMR